ncbi:hypothetical protein ACFQVC_32865 [Streptomyces monticola]|uniref:Uncharacterized protein n=1 Tax=Streptomyces monticola TaxID=2666263 RepID=A0ABW2JUT4_9ACTN
MNRSVLAGELDDLGTSLIDMLKDWGTKGLVAALIVIVVVETIRRFSIKAGIAALLLMVIALGIYNAREDLAGMFEDEIKNPKSAPAPRALLATRPADGPGTGGVQ